MPSMAPSQTGPAPIAARKAGSTAVAVSWLQSLNKLVRPTPRTVRLSQEVRCEDSGTAEQFNLNDGQLRNLGSFRFTELTRPRRAIRRRHPDLQLTHISRNRTAGGKKNRRQ